MTYLPHKLGRYIFQHRYLVKYLRITIILHACAGVDRWQCHLCGDFVNVAPDQRGRTGTVNADYARTDTVSLRRIARY